MWPIIPRRLMQFWQRLTARGGGHSLPSKHSRVDLSATPPSSAKDAQPPTGKEAWIARLRKENPHLLQQWSLSLLGNDGCEQTASTVRPNPPKTCRSPVTGIDADSGRAGSSATTTNSAEPSKESPRQSSRFYAGQASEAQVESADTLVNLGPPGNREPSKRKQDRLNLNFAPDVSQDYGTRASDFDARKTEGLGDLTYRGDSAFPQPFSLSDKVSLSRSDTSLQYRNWLGGKQDFSTARSATIGAQWTDRPSSYGKPVRTTVQAPGLKDMNTQPVKGDEHSPPSPTISSRVASEAGPLQNGPWAEVVDDSAADPWPRLPPDRVPEHTFANGWADIHRQQQLAREQRGL